MTETFDKISRNLIRIRKELHQNPEISGSEFSTAGKIAEYLKDCEPSEIHEEVGGTGILARFSATSGKAKKNLLFRAELDAIAVHEETGVKHQSGVEGVMHGCGHDGHMAILLGLAEHLRDHLPEQTDVYLLFQPAEETGEGAARVMADGRFSSLEIDHGFALHNLPGFEENVVIIKEGVFASASTGVEVAFRGKSSHAAYPEQGLNPSTMMVEFIREADSLLNEFRSQNELNKAVNTFIRLGEPAFGISPGTGKLGFTLRSPDDRAIELAVEQLSGLTDKLGKKFGGSIELKRAEPFAATKNSEEGVKVVKNSARNCGMKTELLESPFPWSEDFGEFGKQFPITLFGLGAGRDHPHLHSEKYDFNDRLISTGIKLFAGIVKQFR